MLWIILIFFDEKTAKYKGDPAKAICEIFRICEEGNILKEYLAEHRGEVEKIMLTMVSPEYIEKAENKTKEIKGSIEAMRSFGRTEKEMKDYLVRKFGITPGYAQNCLDADWEEDDF